MPAFLIHDPLCVFIHNPKTGGQSLRQVLLRGGFEGPVTGRLPLAWQQHFVFAFVRNPFDRLVSAWKMFSEGIEDTGWKVPLDLTPGIGLAEFLGIVTDESIGYGSGKRDGKVRIRNHSLPQTHDFYSVDQADFIGRYENYDHDVEQVLNKLGLSPQTLPRRHVSKRGPYQPYFDAVTRRQAESYYADDLRAFGYTFDPLSPP